MSNRQLEKQQDREKKRAEQIKSGKVARVHWEGRKTKKAQPNRKSTTETVEDEMQERQQVVESAAQVYHRMLPGLLKKLDKIKDPRQPHKIKHKITVLMVYGILLFVYQKGSRRIANKEMTTPTFLENVRAVFPDLETVPHADTLARFLERTDVEEIQNAMIDLLKGLIKNKRFKNLLINGKYLVAVDGTQSFSRNYPWQEEALKRTVGRDVKTSQYYVYILDAVLILDNGMVLPVMSEILENKDWVEGETKQDCERNAFKRMAPRLRKIFGKGKVTLLGDGLYSCGPVIRICRDNKWDFMLVLKEDGSKDLWKEATGLMRIDPSNSLLAVWGDRKQHYQWANGIEYQFGLRQKDCVEIHVVICSESWEEGRRRSTGIPEKKETRYAWISSNRLSEKNVFMRCTKIARYRWKQENNFLIEKHQGYSLEHCYSYDWQAMKGFHYLMKIGHFVNAMLIHSESIAAYIDENGIRAFIRKLVIALNGAELDTNSIESAIKQKYLWKLKTS